MPFFLWLVRDFEIPIFLCYKASNVVPDFYSEMSSLDQEGFGFIMFSIRNEMQSPMPMKVNKSSRYLRFPR